MRTLLRAAAFALPAIAIAAISAQAQDTPVSKHENQEFSEYGFEAMDVDGDGILTEREFVAGAATSHGTSAERARELFAEFAGEDGKLTRVEFVTPLSEDAT